VIEGQSQPLPSLFQGSGVRMEQAKSSYPLCPKCGTQTRPATVEEKAMYGPLTSMPGLIAWQCPKCPEGGVRPAGRS
jgi:hypothetical protein